jgi:hypothetical protein
MTAFPPTTTRPRRRGLTAVALVALAALAGACAQKADDGPTAQTDGGKDPKFQATAQYLAAAVKQSKAKPYKFTFGFDISVAGTDLSADHLMSGQVDGRQAAVTMDGRQAFQSVPGLSSISGDLTLDMVTDQKALYVKAPLIDTLSDEGGLTGTSGFGPLNAFGGLGGGWGKVDLTALGDDASIGQVMGSTGVQGGDPGKFLDMVKDASDPHDLGRDTIDGVAVKGLGATSTFKDLIRSEGVDADEYFRKLGTSVPQSMIDQVLALKVPMEVWVDGDNQVRRIKLDVDMNKLLEKAGAGEMGDARMSMSMDFTDYGDSSIAIQIPSDATDVTAKFRDALPG